MENRRLMITEDFDADGHQDLAVATRGDRPLYL